MFLRERTTEKFTIVFNTLYYSHKNPKNVYTSLHVVVLHGA